MYNPSYTTWSYGTSYGNPEVHIAVNNNRVKSYSVDGENQVYLSDETEFQLEFYNNSNTNVKAEITINGKIQNNALVLRPHQRFYLDRFMDEKNKFKFNTFMTGDDDIDKLKEIIAKNGRIEVKFYREFIPVQITFDTFNMPDTQSPYYREFQTYYSSATSGNSNRNMLSLKSFKKETETGRVESGEKSKQNFTPVSKQWEVFSCAVYTYHIMPESKRPEKVKKVKNVIQADDIRSYCPTCGRRVKKGHNFCPGCGGKF